MRGFRIAKGFENMNIELPKRSTSRSAGYDISLAEDLTIEPGKIGLGATGIKAFMQDDEVLMMVPRSSLPTKHGLILPNSVGIIDSDYFNNPTNDGLIHIQLYNIGSESVTIKKGERVVQGIFKKYLTVQDEDEILTMRTGGFGSTD